MGACSEVVCSGYIRLTDYGSTPKVHRGGLFADLYGAAVFKTITLAMIVKAPAVGPSHKEVPMQTASNHGTPILLQARAALQWH